MNRKLFLSSLLLLSFLLPLGGCIEKAVHVAREAPPMLDRLRLLKMAEEGDVEAQYNLGENYCCGGGVFHDNAQALYWWCQAGRQGQADALYEIGKLYQNTRGDVGSEVPVDPARAYAFYKLAEKGHHKDAKISRSTLENKLNKEEKFKADEIVRMWPEAACEMPSTLKPKPDPSLMIRDPKRNTI